MQDVGGGALRGRAGQVDADGIVCPAGLADEFVHKHYELEDRRFRRVHPRDVLSHAIDIIHFEDLPMRLTEDLLDRAYLSCFAESVDVTE